MNPEWVSPIRDAASAVQLPGLGERRVILPASVERLSASLACARWELEAAALEVGVLPLHFLRNVARFGEAGQARLLRGVVSFVGRGPVMIAAAERLASSGVGRFRVLVPQGDDTESEARSAGEAVAAAARNRNASAGVEVRTVGIREGTAGAALRGSDVVAAFLDDSSDEQLLQFACRMAKAPLVLAGAAVSRGQITTVMPGDPGVALVYKPSHPHLDPRRHGSEVDRRIALVVGSWITEQVERLLLDEPGVLRGILLYADQSCGEMGEYVL